MNTQELKTILAAQGYWEGPVDSDAYGPKTRKAVAYFQSTHLGPDGKPLLVTGELSVATEWALRNPTGAAQRSNLPNDRIPAGIGPKRRRILEVALAQQGIAEQPNGSNRGTSPNGGVDKFLPEWAKTTPGPAWCCFSAWWVLHEALGSWLLGKHHGSCTKAWAEADDRGLTVRNVPGALPCPGDLFLIGEGDDMHHIGIVYRVAADGSAINTAEGNCGNRFKVGRRSLRDGSIAGWIITVPAESALGELGLVEAVSSAADGTR